MKLIAAAPLTAGTLAQVVVGALVAGLGITLAFSAVIYCYDRASELRRADRGGSALAFSAAAAVAGALCLALVAGGLLLVVSKPK